MLIVGPPPVLGYMQWWTLGFVIINFMNIYSVYNYKMTYFFNLTHEFNCWRFGVCNQYYKYYLNTHTGHLKASELKCGTASASIAKQIGSERQLKQAVFESIVKQKALEERNNRLRFVVNT